MATVYYYQEVVAKLLKQVETFEQIAKDEGMTKYAAKAKKMREQLGKINYFANKGNTLNEGIIDEVRTLLSYAERDMDADMKAANKEGMKVVVGVNDAIDNKKIDLETGKKIIRKVVEFNGLGKSNVEHVHETRHSNVKK